MSDPFAQPQLKAQNLEGLKLDELTPLTPEVISRQATINIGTCHSICGMDSWSTDGGVIRPLRN